MSLQEIQDLRRRLEDEQRLREKEQQLREQAEQSQIQAEEQLKLQTQETTLPEFLDACHVHLFLRLSIQKDRDSSTKGDPANADHKLRPTKTVESRVASVVKQLHANPRLRQVFYLNRDITFKNHANTLTDESNFIAEMDSLSLSQRQPRRSNHLAAKLSRVGLSAQPPQSHLKAIQSRTSQPQADQFCVYNKGPKGKVPTFIIEYKAPHKVSLAHIRAGLQDMDLDEVLHLQEEESPEDIYRHTIAAIITQTFSYMIHCGVEFGLVCTGKAYIYLRVSHNDPSTIYYYLSVPEEDVRRTTGWTGDLNSNNQLHLTAVGQLLAFTLRALRELVQDITWTTWAASKLQT
ncbi:hypothetical protein IFM51744_10050 [Aspergillus udagawae]|nr:hypothetical protein IFM51744_10050 [Aspergillus udagawae]